MPRGVYLYEDGVSERFSCAVDGGGWRYSAVRSDGGSVELIADGRWRPGRLELVAGEQWLRGGGAGAELLWVSGGREWSAKAAGFVAGSPGLLVAVARCLDLRVGERVDVPVVEVAWPALGARTVPRRWALIESETHEDVLPVERYEITDLETGEASDLHLAGDVAVGGEGFTLTELEHPPNFS